MVAEFRMRTFLLLLCTSVMLGCEKTVEFELSERPSKLVVEGVIENGVVPVVVLTTSVDYFSAINPGSLLGSFVRDAEVLISNGTKTHRLKGYQRQIAGGRSLFYYSTDSSNLATAFVGQLNTKYALEITWKGEVFRAETTIPEITRRVDSLWWIPAVNAEPDAVNVVVRATDRPGLGDYIRYATSINGQAFLPGFNSVFDDIFIDGTTYEIQVEPGIDRNGTAADDERFFHRGDTVVFKLSNIDKATYDFWRTMEYSYQSVGNPFSTPVKVLGNISNGALGYFGGYATQYHRLVIPR